MGGNLIQRPFGCREKKCFILCLFSEVATILITVRRHDINFELSVVHEQLRSALLKILQNQAVIISRFGNLCCYSFLYVDHNNYIH